MNEIDIFDKNYTEWKTELPCDFSNKNPFSYKLFHKDKFDIDFIIQESPTRNATFLTGILILEQNRTFGRTSNKKRLYYSCIPNQSQLPIFLVPYEIQLGFQKNIKNKYVLFRFDHWTPLEKHPYGILVQTIGDVDILPHYYEYRLYSKNIHPTNLVSKCNRKIKDYLKQTPLSTNIHTILNNPKEYGYIEDKVCNNNNESIFTIDPTGCVDRDDALSIIKTENPHIFKIQVYIANVWLWIKFFDLWELLEKTNCSTIYLPDFNRNMLPAELSENICSLNEGDIPHFTFGMEFEINISEKTLIPIYNNTNGDIIIQKCIRISKNFDYESKSLLKYTPYNLLLQKTREIVPDIKDSHELVSFWMMQMNTFLAKEMSLKKIGIFRTTTSSSTNPNIKSNPTSILHIWEHAISGKYIEYSDSSDFHHQILNVSHYMHFTSPIRRKVDIYNQLLWMSDYISIPLSSIDSINEDTKKIRKIQNECTLLHILQNTYSDGQHLITDGIILQIINTEKVLVYLPTYKCILSCKCSSLLLELYMSVKCKIYVFERESDYKKKIQLCII